jgi:uncharacterized LabA/DUF88 family protein
MAGRTAFIIDGFNVYHSLVEASSSLGLVDERGTKWLDLRSLCKSYLPLFGRDATLAGVYYFSAVARHLQASKPGVAARHEYYAKVLRLTGVSVEMSSFKPKRTKCRVCGKPSKTYVEKETDVAVAVKVLEIFHVRSADRVVLMTGDTDVAPAVRAARRMFPSNEVSFAFPWNRSREELSKLVQTPCISMSREVYVAHQFPDPLVIGNRSVAKPPSW